MKTSQLEANLAALGMTYEQYDEIASFPLDQLAASILVTDLIRSIRIKGSTRQRDEGIQLLKRVRARYTEQFAARSAQVEQRRRELLDKG